MMHDKAKSWRPGVLATAFAFAAGANLACGRLANAEENALQNPDFEQVENGLPKGWTRYAGDGHVDGWKEFDPKKHQTITMALSSEEHKTGERSIFMRCDESVICGFGQKLEVKGDGIYLFSAWVKCEALVAAGEGGAIIFEFDDDAKINGIMHLTKQTFPVK
ncbi:MAG: hypothetical protein ABIP48_26490 [Planctomycetota bacterium]